MNTLKTQSNASGCMRHATLYTVVIQVCALETRIPVDSTSHDSCQRKERNKRYFIQIKLLTSGFPFFLGISEH